jgi:hypothetical protein
MPGELGHDDFYQICMELTEELDKERATSAGLLEEIDRQERLIEYLLDELAKRKGTAKNGNNTEH